MPLFIILESNGREDPQAPAAVEQLATKLKKIEREHNSLLKEKEEWEKERLSLLHKLDSLYAKVKFALK